LWELNANDLTPIGTDSDWEMVVTAGGVVPLGHWQSYTSDVLALKSDASLWSWGGNGAGQLGDGTTISRNEPGHVGTDLDWTALSAAAYHSLGLKSDGSLWAWGANGSGQLGVDTQGGSVLEPNRVGLDSDWAAVAAGQNFSIGLRSDGSLWAWGWNGLGQLGLGGEFNEDRTTPTRIGSDNNWAQPSAPTARGDFRIFAQSINPDHSRTLYFTHTNYRAYYVLERGDVITNIHQPVGMALASAYPQLRDPSPLASDVAIFYRIRAVPRAQPLDLDGDGIDDFFELRHATLLNPLNPADAALDSDFDGYSNLAEYRAGTDLARLTVRHSIALGLRHTVLLKHDGSLWAWGENTYGQLGDGTYDHRDLPVRIGVDNDWISVAAGRDPVSGDHTVALKRDGSLWAWGANNYGQLGFPDSANVPTRIGTGRSWTDVAAGGGYTMAVQRDGSLWAWGNSSVVNPCCGNSWVPTRVGTGRDWTTIAAGGQHVLALKADRSLWTWGINDWGQLGLGEGVFPGAEPTRVGTDNDWTAVAATGDTDNFNGGHSLALKADGSLWAWGHNDWGQLGHGFTGASATNFVPTRVGTDADWAAIAASSPHSMARKRDGSLWVWGFGVSAHPVGYGTNNAWGDFAVGGTLSPPTPMLATAVRSDGSLWSSILGGARNVPTFIANDSDWEFVTAGLAHTLALKTNGTAWTWGANWAGQLGDGMPGTSGFVPQLLDTGTGWSALAAGDSHTLGIQFDGTLWAWGENQYGQLGTEPSVLRAIPARIGSSNDWKAVAAGGGNSFALKNDGSLWTWGRNDHGQLGIGAAINVSVPTRVGTNQDWAVISARGEHTLALKTDGSLWAWGRNGYGQVGDGSTTDRTQPVRIGLESNWVAVAAGYAYTLALRDDGSLWAWGANWNGQLGDGTRMDRSSPVRIGTQNNWAAIAASSHSLGLKTDGSLWAWGANWAGQLGIGSSMEQTSPTRVGTDTDWVSITAGGSHSLARKANGTLWSWGSNDTGQLGLAPELFPRRLGTDIDWGSPP
jgi:alpha-tubulin suppressor-like RCC1 family protein